MKDIKKSQAIILRQKGYALNHIAKELGISKSSASIWLRDVALTEKQQKSLRLAPYTNEAIENRRRSRLRNELQKRRIIIEQSRDQIPNLNEKDLWLMGVMLYWAKGGKTQRMVRFSNGDPKMIKIMIKFFLIVCDVNPEKLRGYIHIHQTLDHKLAEQYWSKVSGIPIEHFFKTYRKPNKSSLNKKHSLPYGVMDIYIQDVTLFNKISGWASGIFDRSIDM